MGEYNRKELNFHPSPCPSKFNSENGPRELFSTAAREMPWRSGALTTATPRAAFFSAHFNPGPAVMAHKSSSLSASQSRERGGAWLWATAVVEGANGARGGESGAEADAAA
jgi:hypothetical protein